MSSEAVAALKGAGDVAAAVTGYACRDSGTVCHLGKMLC